MSSYKLILCFFSAVLLMASCLKSEEQQKCEAAVISFLGDKFTDYDPGDFDAVYEQKYSIVQDKIKSAEAVKYSVVHSYTADGSVRENIYFHLDSQMTVLGQMSSKQMADMTIELLKDNNEVISPFNDIPQ